MAATVIFGLVVMLATASCFLTVKLELHCFKLLRKRLTSLCWRVWHNVPRGFVQNAQQIQTQAAAASQPVATVSSTTPTAHVTSSTPSSQTQTAGASQLVPTVSSTTPTAHVTSPATVRYETEAASIDIVTNSIWNDQYCRLITNQKCTDFITKLVSLNWNTARTGVGRDARGL